MNHLVHRRGFTLVEGLLAAVILSLTVCCVLAPFVAGAQTDQDNAQAALASGLAQELLEDILAKPFADPQSPDALTPGPDAGETSDPRTFDNVDDYDGLYEPPGSFADRPVSGPARAGPLAPRRGRLRVRARAGRRPAAVVLPRNRYGRFRPGGSWSA